MNRTLLGLGALCLKAPPPLWARDLPRAAEAGAVEESASKEQAGAGGGLWVPTVTDILDARLVIRQHLGRTPLYLYPALSELLGCQAYVKHENHQPIGAFKIRGGLNLVSRLTAGERQQGLITASTGNHGQSLAYAGRLFDVPVKVVVPEKANPDKVAAMRRWGATVLFHGEDGDAAVGHAEALSSQEGLRYVHPANEPHLIAGVGTVALEILEELPEVDAILVPVGGGSQACGVSLVVKALRPKTEVIGVQSEGAPAAYLSWKSGAVQLTKAVRTFAEGLATRRGYELPLKILRQQLDDFVLVSDDQLRRAMRALLLEAHLVAEGAGAAATAAAWDLRERLRGKRVALWVSGGNATAASIESALAAGPLQ